MEFLDVVFLALVFGIAWSLFNDGGDGGKRDRQRSFSAAAA